MHHLAGNVATREGGVDRNSHLPSAPFEIPAVATREGGVDRNAQLGKNAVDALLSPPARVAWIETTFAENGGG